MKRLVHMIVVLFAVITTLQGCSFLLRNPSLDASIKNFINSTNYYMWVYAEVEYPNDRVFSERWIVKRDEDKYWIESSFNDLELYRENHGDTYNQSIRYGKSADFSANSTINYKDYLLDLTEMNSNWFKVDEDNPLLYHAKEQYLPTKLDLGKETLWFDINDVRLTLKNYSIELTKESLIKEIYYEIDTSESYQFNTSIKFVDFGSVSLGTPLGVKYPNVVDELYDWTRHHASMFNVLNVQLDYEPYYEIKRETFDYFTIQFANSDTVLHSIIDRYNSNFTSFTIEDNLITTYVDRQPYNIYPPSLISSYTDSDFEIVGENPLRFRLNDVLADQLSVGLKKPEMYGVDDIPIKILNVIIESVEDYDQWKIEFDRISENGMHHWSFLYDLNAEVTMDPRFSSSHFPLELLTQMYHKRARQVTTMKSSTVPATASFSYRMDRLDNYIVLSGYENDEELSDFMTFKPLLGNQVWMNTDGTLTYQPVIQHADKVTTTIDGFGFPFELIDMSEWNVEWFSENILDQTWDVKPEHYSEFLTLIGFDYLHASQEIEIQSFQLYFVDYQLAVIMKGVLPDLEILTFTRVYDTGPN